MIVHWYGENAHFHEFVVGIILLIIFGMCCRGEELKTLWSVMNIEEGSWENCKLIHYQACNMRFFK